MSATDGNHKPDDQHYDFKETEIKRLKLMEVWYEYIFVYDNKCYLKTELANEIPRRPPVEANRSMNCKISFFYI